MQTFAPQSQTQLIDAFSTQVIPTQYNWYRVRAHIDQGNTCQAFDFYSPEQFICSNTLMDAPTTAPTAGHASPAMHHW